MWQLLAWHAGPRTQRHEQVRGACMRYMHASHACTRTFCDSLYAYLQGRGGVSAECGSCVRGVDMKYAVAAAAAGGIRGHLNLRREPKLAAIAPHVQEELITAGALAVSR